MVPQTSDEVVQGFLEPVYLFSPCTAQMIAQRTRTYILSRIRGGHASRRIVARGGVGEREARLRLRALGIVAECGASLLFSSCGFLADIMYDFVTDPSAKLGGVLLVTPLVPQVQVVWCWKLELFGRR